MKEMFKKFFNTIKVALHKIDHKKAKIAVSFTLVSLAAGFFAFKYIKTFKILDMYKSVLKDTQTAFAAANAKCTQLTLDNTVLAEMLGMVLGVPANIYD